MESIYRQIITPSQDNINIPVPNEWKGMEIEVIAFPISASEYPKKEKSIAERRKEIDEIFDKHLISLANFKFDRDEANNYD